MIEKNERPESYPRPTETDKQLQNQPEYIDQQPNHLDDESISDSTLKDTDVQQTNNPDKQKD